MLCSIPIEHANGLSVAVRLSEEDAMWTWNTTKDFAALSLLFVAIYAWTVIGAVL